MESNSTAFLIKIKLRHSLGRPSRSDFVQLELKGEGGTDFRPAFSYVDELVRQHTFEHLRGMIYFTDGRGIYPAKRPVYETAFVFMEEDYEDVDVPPWAIKIILEEDLDF